MLLTAVTGSFTDIILYSKKRVKIRLSSIQKSQTANSRYSSLAKEFPQVADKLFELTEKQAMERYEDYKKLSEMK